MSRRGHHLPENTGDRLEPPSKSARKREHEALQDLARRVLEAGPGRVDRLALEEVLAQAIREGRRIPASSARARHIRYLGKLLAADPAGAAVLDRALSEDRAAHAQEVAQLHRLEHWRDRLLGEGDAALTELVAQHPAVDGAAVRDLVRQARKDEGTPRHVATVRRLFRLLRSALGGGSVDRAST
jgi:ribosome-associated protein